MRAGHELGAGDGTAGWSFTANSVAYQEFLSACGAARDPRSRWSISDQMRPFADRTDCGRLLHPLETPSQQSRLSDLQRGIEFMDEMQELVHGALSSPAMEVSITTGRLDRPAHRDHAGA